MVRLIDIKRTGRNHSDCDIMSRLTDKGLP